MIITKENEFFYAESKKSASLVKKQTHLPVICVGNIFTGDEAEQILKDDLANLIAVRRGSLADPAWAKKTLAGETPNPCLKCKSCMWCIGGKSCPARRKGENKK